MLILKKHAGNHKPGVREKGASMRKNRNYVSIDMEQTGRILRQKIRQKGYSVKDIQKLLHLSCPQPVYRWFKGQILPSVDHLYVLSRVLSCHMEELLVEKREEHCPWQIIREYREYTGTGKRINRYLEGLTAVLAVRAEV